MRYLSTALVSEGPSDDRFLPRLLARSLTELCLTEFDTWWDDTREALTALGYREGK